MQNPTTKKWMETRRQIDELLKQSREDIIKSIDKALECGALPKKMLEIDSYLLAKFLVTAYFHKEPYAPTDKTLQKELANLEHFI
jgi:hypothetical protein